MADNQQSTGGMIGVAGPDGQRRFAGVFVPDNIVTFAASAAPAGGDDLRCAVAATHAQLACGAWQQLPEDTRRTLLMQLAVAVRRALDTQDALDAG